MRNRVRYQKESKVKGKEMGQTDDLQESKFKGANRIEKIE